MNSEINLTILEIGVLLCQNSRSLTNKSNRQDWFFAEEHKKGTPKRMYPIDSLPDEIQAAWASWDQEKATAAAQEYEAKDIPAPITENEAKEALSWPERQEFFKKDARQWNGTRGLCPQARALLLMRFPDLGKAPKEQKIKPVPKPGQNLPAAGSRFDPPKVSIGALFQANKLQINESESSSDLVPIRQFQDIRASAGTGYANFEEQSVDILLSRRFLMKHFNLYSPAELDMIQVFGNSMTPTLEEGNMAILNRSEPEIRDGGIYVIRLEGQLYIKRVQTVPGRKVFRLLSDNKDFQPIDTTPESDIAILGRVVGAFVTQRF